MTTPDPRERAVEHLLRQTRDTGRSEACLDAETLAAWADGGLRGSALDEVERHMAGCARCQAMMATLVKTEHDVAVAGETVTEPWWGRWSIRWLAPLTAAAAATLVWMIVPDQRSQPRPAPPPMDSIQARAEANAPVAPAEAGSPAPATAPPSAEADRAVTREALGKVETETAAKPAEEVAGRAQGGAATFRADAPAAAGARQEADKQVTPGARTAAESLTVERRGADIASAGAAQPAPAAPAPPPAAAARSAEPAAKLEERAADRLAAAGPAISSNRLTAVIVSRDPAVQWRIAGPRVIERSTDGGGTWQRLDTGVDVDLTAGISPSTNVCWLVGRRGTVLLTTDARTWRRVPSPTTDDLIAVDATGATNATVRTASGAAYRTSDGGVTWTLSR